jgi:hypothetical protein
VRVLAAAILFMAVHAAPAGAQTVVRGELGGGPALAGDAIAWAEGSRDAVRVLTRAPGGERRLLHRVAPPTARRTTRGIPGGRPGVFDASATSYAAFASTSTVTSAESDSVSSSSTFAAFGGPFGAPPAMLAGCLPARGDLGCGETCGEPGAVAVDGDRIAVSEVGGPCDRPEERQAWITIHGPGGPTTVDADLGAVLREVRHLRLAGDYLAWISWDTPNEVVVYDLAASAVVVRLTARDLGARSLYELALQADGTVAFLYSGRRDRRGVRLGWTAPGRAGVTLIDRHADYSDIALDGGRILYGRILSERRFTGELVLRPLGGPARRLAHFPERRRRVGDVDLDGSRAAWAVQPTRRGYDPQPRGPARIVVRSP